VKQGYFYMADLSSSASKRIAVVLFNLGGPDSLDAVKPFLFNLFNDPAIIGAPKPIRWLLAKLISGRRAPIAREIYSHLGGRSPLVPLTEDQAHKLSEMLNSDHVHVDVHIAMRYWHPRAEAVVQQLEKNKPDEIVLLPLYPQFSTATSGSSIDEWHALAGHMGIKTHTICCYPTEQGFITASRKLLTPAIRTAAKHPNGFRVLFSAHGLPEDVIAKGDPYQSHVEQTAAAIMDDFRKVEGDPNNLPDVEWLVTYQSRVGPKKWIEPFTDKEIERAGAENKALVIVPLAFVSEHSETLVELDIEYRELADAAGVPIYVRVATVCDHDDFIAGLAKMVQQKIEPSSQMADPCAHTGKRLCDAKFTKCRCKAV
jgi:ferrochelatase